MMLNDLSLFSGIGGIEVGLESLGSFRTIGYVEKEPYCQAILVKNMELGNISPAPIWDDVRTFDGRAWKGVVDIISGGFPCQDISIAGKRRGIKEGTRSGLWFEFKRLVCEIRPKYVLVENVSAITQKGIDIVLGQLSEIGYDAVWFPLQAREVGAPHRRERIFIIGWDSDRLDESKVREILERNAPESARNGFVANARRKRWDAVAIQHGSVGKEVQKTPEGKSGGADGIQTDMANAFINSQRTAFGEGARWHADKEQDDRDEIRDDTRDGSKDMADSNNTATARQRELSRQIYPITEPARPSFCSGEDWWATEPDVGRVAYGIPFRVDRLKVLGNAVVPQVAREVGKVILWLEQNISNKNVDG